MTSERSDALFVDLTGNEDKQRQTFKLSVIYKCFKTGNRHIKVTIPWSNSRVGYEVNATFAWTKACVAGQDRFGLSVVTEQNKAVVMDGVTTGEWNAANPQNVVGLRSDSSRFFLGVKVGSQTYSAPKITVSQPFVVVTLLGNASTSNIVEFGEVHVLEVKHDCVATNAGRAQVTIVYDIAPFNAITFSWIKDCSSHPPNTMHDEKDGTTVPLTIAALAVVEDHGCYASAVVALTALVVGLVCGLFMRRFLCCQCKRIGPQAWQVDVLWGRKANSEREDQ
jgi:hypothetical protein